jgi:hypothetical protein
MITVQLYYMQYLIMTKKMNNLQVPQKDMEKEIAQLESFIKSDIDARELSPSNSCQDGALR